MTPEALKKKAGGIHGIGNQNVVCQQQHLKLEVSGEMSLNFGEK